MKVLTLNTNNSAGGATKACFRLHTSLVERGIEADLLMLERPRGVPRGHEFYAFHVQQRQAAAQKRSLPQKLLYKAQYQLGRHEDVQQEKRQIYEKMLISQMDQDVETPTFALSPYQIHEHPLVQQADVLHLHCLIANFLNYKTFFQHVQKPMVWTLHDMNPFTGGCIYSGTCEGFKTDCAICPQLIDTVNPGYTGEALAIKKEGMAGVDNLTIVSPSRWLLEQSKESALFKKFPHQLIPYGIDSKSFQPRDRQYSRQLLGLPQDKPVILFVSHAVNNKRKGYQYLLKALQELNLSADEVTLCAVGAKSNDGTQNSIYELGSFSDERLMSIAYSAADVFVIPSLADNLPNTVLESLLCGTPVIGFPVGGIVDMVADGRNGYLCREIGVAALAEKLKLFLDNPAALNRDWIREDAVLKYDTQVQADRYISLYKTLLGQRQIKPVAV